VCSRKPCFHLRANFHGTGIFFKSRSNQLFNRSNKIPNLILDPKSGVRVCTQLCLLTIVPAVGSCEDSNELTGSIKFGELDYLVQYQHLK
jgi:hypothetical protein